MTKRGTTAYGRPIDRQTTNAFGRVVETQPGEETQLKQRLSEVYAKHLRNQSPSHEAYLSALRGSVGYYTKLIETHPEPTNGRTTIQQTRKDHR